ncbi:electron transfer flavoprotein subunit beta/FixA family protein [Mucilaginibacter sp.]|uniref:electron transfer flavoprotein subunit beta/FixA family protein n=1 Tax=Mucilaginibacter sp. TaxID=1882438 RepID=UPI003B00FF91
MNVLVCISVVPDTTAKITFTDNNTQFNKNGVQFILNPYDEIALSRAIDLGGKVTVIHVGAIASEAVIRKALAIGATDAVRIDAEPADAYFVAYQLTQFIKANPFDLVLAGMESIDYNGAKVAAMLGEMLDLPSVSVAKKLDIEGNTALIEREIEGGKEILSIQLPVIIGTAEGVAEWKIPNMRGTMAARTKPIQVLKAVALDDLAKIIAFETPEPRGKVKLISAENTAGLINSLHQEARVI